MVTINLNSKDYLYNKETKTFTMSERGIPFGTSYEVYNPKTGGKKVFDLSHSTGPEFDPSTRWVYKSADGINLEICNDAEMTKAASESYLAAKIRKS